MARHWRYYVYHWDKIVYIGHTSDPAAAFAEHERESPWWDEAHQVRFFRHASKQTAMSAVERGITIYKPRHNNKNVTPCRR